MRWTSAILIFWMIALHADEVVLSAGVDRATVTTGDMLMFTITMERKTEIEAAIPEIGSKIQGFRIEDFGTETPQREGDLVVEKRWYKLQADLSGSYILPAVKVEYVNQAKEKKEVSTSEIFVEVKSVLPKEGEEAKDIRDIKALSPSKRHLSLLSIIIISVLFLTVITLGFLWFKTRRGTISKVEEIPCYQRALASLGELEKTEMVGKRFHFSLSEIMRLYLEQMFSLPATDMTLEEIKKAIKKLNQLSQKQRDDFLHLLKQTDLVKFTDSELDKAQGEQLLQCGRLFVEQTMPKLVSQEEESVV